MRLQTHLRTFLPAVLALLLPAMTGCHREPDPEGGREGLVMLSAGTKSLPTGINTFRVALFTENREYSGRNGTYCTETLTHVDDYSETPGTYTWLKPCRVDGAGTPLDINGDPVSDVSEADHDGKWGLRWNSYYNSSWTNNAYLVALAPARAFVHETGSHAAYVDWTPDTRIYISEPVLGSFYGTWFKNQFVYHSSDDSESSEELSKTLLDHRASLTLKVQCDRIPATTLRAIYVKHRIIRDRFYLQDKENEVRGYSLPECPHYKFDDDDPGTDPVPGDFAPLYLLGPGAAQVVNKPDYPTAGTPEATWTSDTPFYVQARDYKTATVDELRPLIFVQLGPDPDNPVTVKIPIDYDLKPMKNYTLILDVSNTYVTVHCSVANWTDGGGGSVGEETPAYLGTVTIDGEGGAWDDNGNQGAEPL